MLKIKTDKGTIEELEIDGNFFDICADVMVMIRSIYTVISKEDEDEAKDFEVVIKDMVLKEKDLFKPFEPDMDMSDESQQ